MKIVDIIFALICGRVVAWIAVDFLKGYEVDIGIWRWFLLWVLPIISLFCLWLACLIGKKLLFVFQAAKFFLTGAFATVVDIKIFQFVAWLLSLAITANPLIPKAISFLAATFAKYWGNKYWAFEKNEKEGLNKEIAQFFIVTLAGLALDLGSFYYLINIMGPQFGMPFKVWQELSIILAALVAALWNFLGYKFIVFKK